MNEVPGTLRSDEYHPAADSAKKWLLEHLATDPQRAFRLAESFASTAMSGNRLAEICGETLRRLLAGEPVSDRYLLGLCWIVRNMHEADDLPGARRIKRKMEHARRSTSRRSGQG